MIPLTLANTGEDLVIKKNISKKDCPNSPENICLFSINQNLDGFVYLFVC